MSAAYTSNAVPFGGMTAEIFRAAVSLGTYNVESLALSIEVVEGKRPDVYGGDNGWWIVKGTTTGTAVIQCATTATPTLEPGDYFTVDFPVNSAGAATSYKVVIKSISDTRAAGEYRKQSCNVQVDSF